MKALRRAASIAPLVLAGCTLSANAIPSVAADAETDSRPSFDSGVPPRDGDAGDTAIPPPDSSRPDVGVDPDRCGGPTTLLDDFDDGERGALWRPVLVGASDVSETGGQLRAEPAPGTSAAGYVSAFAVDARDSWAAVRVDEIAGSDPGVTTRLTVLRPTNDAWLALSVTDGALTFQRQPLSGSADDMTLPYEPATHRWWRIREASGTVYWETSPDGAAWVEHRSEPSPAWLHRSHFGLGALSTAPADAAGPARFDDFNYDAPFRPRQLFCPIETLMDGLSGGAQLPEWVVLGAASCDVAHGGSHVRLTSRVGTTADCGFQTTAAYDLRAGSVFVDVPGISSYESTMTYAFVVTDRYGEEQFVAFRDGRYVFRDAAPVTYDDRRYWRIREEDGQLIYGSSDDATDWTDLVREPLHIDPSAVTVTLRFSTSAAATRAVGISAHGVNVD